VRFAVAFVAVVLLAGCGGAVHATKTAQPSDDPAAFAQRVVRLILHNRYAQAWGDLHPVDRAVAPRDEYVGCERRSPILLPATSIRVVGVSSESVGLGNGRFVASKAVRVRIDFPGGLHLVHPVHVVAAGGKWTWILPSWRFRDYKADRCPTDAASAPPPASA
jgi:hypothetical protein